MNLYGQKTNISNTIINFYAFRGAGLGASTHFIQPFENAFLSINLDQIMSKNAYFLKKSCKIAVTSSLGLRRLGDPPSDPRVVTSAY